MEVGGAINRENILSHQLSRITILKMMRMKNNLVPHLLNLSSSNKDINSLKKLFKNHNK